MYNYLLCVICSSVNLWIFEKMYMASFLTKWCTSSIPMTQYNIILCLNFNSDVSPLSIHPRGSGTDCTRTTCTHIYLDPRTLTSGVSILWFTTIRATVIGDFVHRRCQRSSRETNIVISSQVHTFNDMFIVFIVKFHRF